MAIALLALFSVAVFAKGKGRIYAESQEREFELIDKRDGKTYKTVKIGGQVWMAENLNYNANGSKCYDNKPANCEKYGRLYDWNTALKVCPSGWHLPDDNEWTKLMEFLASNKKDVRYGKGNFEGWTLEYYENAGKYLKAKSGWNDNGNGTDEFGFSALPGGGGFFSGVSFSLVGSLGSWWSATEDYSGNAYRRYMSGDYANWDNLIKSNLFSVRCVQD
ncbi:MAG: fibrobacter succinogenes major paralogous domain-containing protein [Candidatus Fibromonas sp.]|nr:fibrobacter succinogenes major paralogous domain-containing protein [Candidatus Fibromonas sp.]